MILDDYKRQLEASEGARAGTSRRASTGTCRRRCSAPSPKVAIFGNPRVIIENLGDEVFAVDADGRPRRVRRRRTGGGPLRRPVRRRLGRHVPRVRLPLPRVSRSPSGCRASSACASTRASALRAVGVIPGLWRGAHPLRRDARLARHARAHDVLARRAPADRRRRPRAAADRRVPRLAARGANGCMAQARRTMMRPPPQAAVARVLGGGFA